MKLSVNEACVEVYFNRGVRALGGIPFKFVSPGNDGVPDRIAVLPGGKIWFVELKKAGGRVSGVQQVQQARISLLGFRVRVAYGMSGVKDVLREMRREVRGVQRSEESGL